VVIVTSESVAQQLQHNSIEMTGVELSSFRVARLRHLLASDQRLTVLQMAVFCRTLRSSGVSRIKPVCFPFINS